MDKTDTAVASIIEQFAHAASAISGPAYDIMLATAKANAIIGLLNFPMALVAGGGFMALTNYLIKKSKNTEEEFLFFCGILSGICAAFCAIAVMVTFFNLPDNYVQMEHPEIALGKAVIHAMESHGK